MVPRALGPEEGLRRDDVRDAVQEERCGRDSLFLGEAGNVGADDGHDNRIVDSREGDHDAAGKLTVLVLGLSRCQVQHNNSGEGDHAGECSQRLLEVPKPARECRRSRNEELHNSLPTDEISWHGTTN